jgi:energy-coupling factor transporter ATP-binding protein EcfA2
VTEPLSISHERAPDSGPRLQARPASTIVATKPDWLWRSWILLRALNLLVGRQGCGKTTLAAHMVGALTRGHCLPGDEARQPLTVGFLSLEEPADRLVARLDAAGADRERVVVFGDVEDTDEEGRTIRRRWTLPKDVGLLEEAADGLALVVVDGLGFTISGDSHNYAVVGSALAALQGVAERTGVAVLGLTHPPKGASDPTTAAIGSTAWTAIPRVSMVLGSDPNDTTGTTRVLSVGKTNYKMPSSSLAFSIVEDEKYECGRVVDLRASTVTAEEVMAASVGNEERTDRAEARDLLRQVLTNGPLDSTVVKATIVDQAGISQRTYARARKDLGIVSTPERDSETGKVVAWTLALPRSATPIHSATTSPALAPWHSGHSGHHQEQQRVSVPERQRAESGSLDESCVLEATPREKTAKRVAICPRCEMPTEALYGHREPVCRDCYPAVYEDAG